MKKQQEKVLVATLAGIIVLSGAALAIQPQTAPNRARTAVETSTLDARQASGFSALDAAALSNPA